MNNLYVLMVVLSGFLCFKDSKGECDLQYLKEPVSSISCNPYLPESLLKLQCDLQISSSSANNGIQILWFFSNGEASPIEISDSNSFPPLQQITRATISQNVLSSIITINGSLLNSSVHAGSYYCQAAMDSDSESLTPSNMLELATATSYLSLQLCMIIQVQDTTRCSGKDTTLPESSTTGDASSPLATRVFGFELRNVEEDLEIGFYILILLLVVILGISVVIIMVFIGRKCDKNKPSPTHSHNVSNQTHSDGVLINMQDLHSSHSVKNNSKTTKILDESTNQGTTKNFLDSLDTFRGRSDSYVSITRDEDKKEIKMASNSTAISEREQQKSSVLLSALPSKPGTELAKTEQYADDGIYEELPENHQDTALQGSNVARMDEVPHNQPESLTSSLTATRECVTMNQSAREEKAASDLSQLRARVRKPSSKPTQQLPPKLPSRESNSSSKPPQVLFKEAGATEDAAVYDAIGECQKGSSSPQGMDQKRDGEFEGGNYDVIPAAANQAYGVFNSAGQVVGEDPENVYEALEEQDLYTTMS